MFNEISTRRVIAVTKASDGLAEFQALGAAHPSNHAGDGILLDPGVPSV
jgi:hypothetical protein